MKKILLVLFISFSIGIQAQTKKVTLEEAIQLAQKKSPDYKANINKNEGSYFFARKG